MKREFVRTETFERSWKAVGLDDNDLRELENMILQNPEVGTIIQGLAGARKLRLALEGRGKSGGARIIYVDVVVSEKVYLLLAYPKNTQTDLTPEQRKTLRKLIIALKGE